MEPDTKIVPIRKKTATPVLDRVGELEKRVLVLEKICANLIRAVEAGEMPSRKSGLIMPDRLDG